MVIISQKPLREFWEIHADAREALSAWYTFVSECDWGRHAEVVRDFNSADYVADGRYVFNIRGNNYRVVARIHFASRTVFIRFIGTHAQYNKINAATI
jgi:mRNA interferase HigB